MTSPIIVTQLNMPGENWREFCKGYTRNDVSDNPQPTSIAKDQIVDNVKISSDFVLDNTKDFSLLEVVNGILQPVSMHLEGINAGTTSMQMVTGFSAVPLVAYEAGALAGITPTADSTRSLTFTTTGYIITGGNTTVYSNQKKEMAPMLVKWNFSDIIGYDGRRVDFVFMRASLEVKPPYMSIIPSDVNLMDMTDFGGGIYMDMFNAGVWVPIYSGGYLSGRTFMMPVNPYHQVSARFMVRGCYNWSLQFLGIITGA